MNIQNYDCLTPNDLRRILSLGATQGVFDHLSSCNQCIRVAEEMCRVAGEWPTVEAEESGNFTSKLRRLFNIRKTGSYLSAILFVPTEVVVVAKDNNSVPFELYVIVPKDFTSRVDIDTLRLSGTVQASNAKCLEVQKGKEVINTVSFEVVTPSKRVIESLGWHYRVTDTVRLTGAYIDAMPFSAVSYATFEGI